MRLLVTALACLISVSMFGEVIRTDINHYGELYKTTLITDSINQQSLSVAEQSLRTIMRKIRVAESEAAAIVQYHCQMYKFNTTLLKIMAVDFFLRLVMRP